LGEENRARIDEIRTSKDPLFLIEVFRTGTDEERNAAADTFCSLPVTKYAPLMEALKKPDRNVRKWVAITIGRTQQADVAPQLVNLLGDRHKDVRDTAFNVVSSLLDPEQLMGLIKEDIDSAKSSAKRKRLGPYLERVAHSSLLMKLGVDRIDIAELKKFGRVVVRNAEPLPPNRPQFPRSKLVA
jgi:HEAT repeat protein